MGCVYNDFEGKCQLLWDYDKEEKREDTNCIDDNGNCVVDEDPNPNCESFDSNEEEICPLCDERIQFDDICVCGYCPHCEEQECECEFE